MPLPAWFHQKQKAYNKKAYKFSYASKINKFKKSYAAGKLAAWGVKYYRPHYKYKPGGYGATNAKYLFYKHKAGLMLRR